MRGEYIKLVYICVITCIEFDSCYPSTVITVCVCVHACVRACAFMGVHVNLSLLHCNCKNTNQQDFDWVRML